jgi:hypothetical protein
MKKKKADPRARIIDLLVNKAAMKQDIAEIAEKALQEMKSVTEEELAELRKSVDDRRVRLSLSDKGKYEFRTSVGSDTLVFQLHTNIFRFVDDHPIWKTPYLQENGANGYFGIINIYNFLAESVENNRFNDLGYLIGRVFLNHQGHFFVEGHGELGSEFQDLGGRNFDRACMQQIVRCAMTYAIEFDLITPPYENVVEISFAQMEAISSDLQLATGKRLGFKFSAEDKDVY